MKWGVGMITSAGELKQEILRIYNVINKRIFNVGVKQQKVDFVGNKIVIVSLNGRVPVLKLLDEEYRFSTRQLDYLLFQVFKREIKAALEQQFQLNIVAVLKDYDAETEFSGTIVVLDRDVEHYLKEPPELR
ncbi:Na-translocating system protein MpsC family protein [Paenibacillus macerans]|uniref:Na-translocating system protein MpsC family protein n=1 Tax=Paenibacillus macerans TaxID=44252 RepID=UPI002DBEEFE0|nr:Na-translocating system protein MpsC family protein [Paenibacillus macerans]MEC0328832.1 Na-translocating system protein MpsC family protein [Paenibacillus macerans]